MISKPFESETMLVKAMLNGYAEEGKQEAIVKGFISEVNEVLYITEIGDDKHWEINPYAVARNSCIKDSYGNYIFEYDLLELTDLNGKTEYGYLEWDDFYNSWGIRRSTEYSGYSDIKKFSKIKAVGNIILNDDDAQKMFDQDAQNNKEYSGIRAPSSTASSDRWQQKCHKEAMRGIGQ